MCERDMRWTLDRVEAWEGKGDKGQRRGEWQEERIGEGRWRQEDTQVVDNAKSKTKKRQGGYTSRKHRRKKDKEARKRAPPK